MDPLVVLELRGPVEDGELSALHGASFGPGEIEQSAPWRSRLRENSLTWVAARGGDGRLVGFVNVVGDGGEHAFLVDTMVAPDRQRGGIGRDLVAAAAEAARALGCHWLHVDYVSRDAAFYEAACGFRVTRAGLLDLRDSPPAPQRALSGSDPLKYARVERERRFLLSRVPDVSSAERRLDITDHYLTGTRLRLREVTEGGTVVRKLGHKVRLGSDTREIACTSLYLDDAEWDLLAALPADTLRKIRHLLPVAGGRVAVDVFAGALAGLVLVEIDGGDGRALDLPAAYEPAAEVTDDEAFTGGALARTSAQGLATLLGHHPHRA